MSTQDYRHIKFIASANKFSQLPKDSGHEVAFAGRSNAGKSSALNTLTDNKRLARTSKTPGRTQLINAFELDEIRRLIDLPGYGYARVSASKQQHWQDFLAEYLMRRQALKGLILLMDIRHPMQPKDLQLLDFVAERQLPVHILLTKADKLSRNQQLRALQQTQKASKTLPLHTTIQLFSSTAKLGLDEAYSKLDEWLERPKNP